LEESVGIRDDRADAHYHLGLARLALGQHEQAEVALRRTVELRPDFAGRDAQLHLVEALRRLERYEEAERICREVLEKQPRSCHARWQWAQLRAAQGDEDGARTAIGETLELARVSPAAVRRRDRRLASKARRLLSNLGRPKRSN
jgi:tetratricopeptide (TPR) repeat protein